MGRLPLFAVTIAALVFLIPATTNADDKESSGRSWLPEPVNDTDYYDDGAPDVEKVQLGAQLFFDKILSGNLNISCATCHHPFAGTADGLSLPVGEGGRGFGVTRDTGQGSDAVHERVPRNAPALFNLGARQFAALFHDGRVQLSAAFPNGIESPAGLDLPEGLDNPLAVQAMFPVTSATEMAGQAGENPIADAAAAGNLAGTDGVWAQLAERLQGIDGYVEQFIAAFDDVRSADDIRFTHAANAIAAFEANSWRADNSPFDRFLRGERVAMSASALLGMRIFYSADKGNCVSCHGGVFQTDHSFRAIAVPQLGPGKGDGAFGYDDFGRQRVTGDRTDRYRFRVPSLRNVAQTAPYGHSGAFNTLEAMLRHHLDAVASLYDYDAGQVVVPARPDLDAQDYLATSDANVLTGIAAANQLAPVRLTEREIRQLIDFLHALTDPAMLDRRADVPKSLPSGMPLAD
ncbi:MAG: cytochrome-c peroxidase [Gammaproteobacteria bacterium]|nr:cytochrome-c peroxidase [Gammaproteobacteria bacterium]MDH3352676.1 cytochrome-c peroxidase [Gammaproteobacteria bacterium]MDH3482094.1 cytochrome-c peroxidase [Gammaproteobacteria bacterium]